MKSSGPRAWANWPRNGLRAPAASNMNSARCSAEEDRNVQSPALPSMLTIRSPTTAAPAVRALSSISPFRVSREKIAIGRSRRKHALRPEGAISSQSVIQLRSTPASRRNGQRTRALSVSPPPHGFSQASFSSKRVTSHPARATCSAANAPAGPPPTIAICFGNIGQTRTPTGPRLMLIDGTRTHNCRLPDSRVARTDLLDSSHCLVDGQSGNAKNEHSRRGPQDLNERSQAIDLLHDFDLLPGHVRL